MSLANEYFFRDDKGAGADQNAEPGNDNNDGFSDLTAKRSYSHFLSLLNNAEPGTVFNLGIACGFIQTSSFRINNNKANTEVVSLNYDGTYITCVTLKPSNIEVGQQTTIRGASDSHFNGLVTCDSVVNPTTFKYLPLEQCSITGPATIDNFSNKLRCDAGAIKVQTYLSSKFVANLNTDPLCEYSDSSQSQHRIDRGATQGISFEDIRYKYTGNGGKPNCFFIWDAGKESFRFHNLEIDGFRIAIDSNNKEARVSDITITKCRIINNWSQGILGGPDYSFIYDNYFDNNGHDNGNGSNRLHNIYLSNCHHTIIRKNETTRSAMKGGQAQGVEIVLHGVCSDIIIEDNYIHNDIGASHGGNYGIEINSGYNTEERFTDCIIRRNKVENCGRRSINCSAWIRGSVDDNILSSEQGYNNTGVVFEASRNTPGTPTSDGFAINNNIVSGSSVIKDVDVQAGTNYTIVRPDDPPEEIPPPIDPPDPDPNCDIRVKTTVEIKVNGIVTNTSETITPG